MHVSPRNTTYADDRCDLAYIFSKKKIYVRIHLNYDTKNKAK